MPTAFVVRRSSVRSVVRGDGGDDGIDLLFAVRTLTSDVSVTRAIVALRMTQTPGVIEREHGSGQQICDYSNAAIVRPNAETTAGLVGTFGFSM